MTVAPIRIDAVVAEAERAAIVAGAEQLSEALSDATGAPWPVQVGFHATVPSAGSTGANAFVILSLLPETAATEPIEDTESRWRARLAALVERGAPVFLCTVFRSPASPPAGPGTPNPRLDRIRRLNLMAIRLSQALGVWVIDWDRALAHVGARALSCDYRLGGRLAAEVAGHQVAWALLSYGIDAAAPQAQERAKTFHGDLQRIDALVERRLRRRGRAVQHG